MLSPNQPLRRLLYKSEPTLAATGEDARRQVAVIVREAAVRNARMNLTGALLYSRDLFVQVLEGPVAALEETFECICCDLRHRNVELLELVSVEHRAFGDWSMVMVAPQNQLRSITDLASHPELLDAPTHAPAALISLMRQLVVPRSTPAPV